MKLSVVIVNYNVKYFLEQCLHSCQRAADQMKVHNPDWDTEIIVVDNNSVDGSVEMVQERFSYVELIANLDNKGFSKANNQAINISTGEYVLLLNPDTVVEEDTFLSTVLFMDETPDAGGLGVKMIDGKGNFLPESKRGLPAPDVAFYKIFGLSTVFPKSKIFGKYHLGFLDKDEINHIDVLAGAFMLLRKETLDKIGLLDETFFMYGEDIDLSYRITQAGYKNYYYPKTRIIHYKGESTKKGSVNYVMVFYNAMIIFAKKHFTANNAALFAFLINLAIYFRAGISLSIRFIKNISHPVLDWALNLTLLTTATHWYARNVKFTDGATYPDDFFNVILPIYSLVWVFGASLTGSYKWLYKTGRLFRGVLAGTLMVALIYAFLDEGYRFSRAMILFGGVISFAALYVTRWLVHLVQERHALMGVSKPKKMVIVGNATEADRVSALLDKTGITHSMVGKVTPNEEEKKGFIGSLRQLQEIVRIHHIDEVIFCAKDLKASRIFNLMLQIKEADVDFKIVPEESLFIIGSNSKDSPGDYYTIDVRLALKSPEHQFNKRVLDISMSLLMLAFLPISLLLVGRKMSFLGNIFKVLAGKKTWVGYSSNHDDINLPNLRDGILKPTDKYNGLSLELKAISRIDMAYARHYHFTKDLDIILRNFVRLGG